ncbi:MAG: hypothetical protein AAGA90_06280 [Actinomycetota bacterium]
MSQIRCVVQHGGNADNRRAELEARLHAEYAQAYGGAEPTISWMPVPAGYMFTEGQQSTSSIVSSFLDRATSLDERERYMRSVCDIWTEVTECTDHEVVVTVTEPEPEPNA